MNEKDIPIPENECTKEIHEHIYWKTKLEIDRERNKWLKTQNILLLSTLICSIIAILVGLL